MALTRTVERKDGECVEKIKPFSAFCVVVFESIMAIVMVVLFVRPVLKLAKRAATQDARNIIVSSPRRLPEPCHVTHAVVALEEKGVPSSPRGRKSSLQRDVQEFVQVVVRAGLMATMTLVSTLFFFFFYFFFMVAFPTILDVCVNSTCLLLMFAMYNKPYRFCCGCFHVVLVKKATRSVQESAVNNVIRSS